ncbi:hypothetical protein CHARACLAT_031417 [Characodon lateralis]|uniref:Uncharacterized protein n=1 Tax=Characodon lateralis TaxID=208331 RepID=A0ABU7DBL3_9TELE|nr:hypothetical protein [Characodon lateralis]
MSKVTSGSTGCRAVVMAGKYLSGPGRGSTVIPGNTGQQRGRMCVPQSRTMCSTTARMGGRTAAVGQQESLGYISTADRHTLANRNLIYRDVKAFLSEVGGDPREARYWLTQFQKANLSQSPAFAVVEQELKNNLQGVSCSLGVHRTSTPRSAVRWRGEPAVSPVSGKQKRTSPNTLEHMWN